MVEITLTPEMAALGQRYLRALQDLRFEPEYVSWGYDTVLEQFVLVVVTDFFDFAGPLRLSEALIQAYNLTATPTELSPFSVRLHSPKHAWFVRHSPLLDRPRRVGDFQPDKRSLSGEWDRAALIQLNLDGVLIHPDWTLLFAKSKRGKRPHVAKRWQRFADTISALAA